MKIIVISDTHNKYQKLQIPKGDMIIFAGDVCVGKELKILRKFADFIDSLGFKHKIMIAGNHDYVFENDNSVEARNILKNKNINYLENSMETIAGINIWGSPVTPQFFDWAFMAKRGEKIAKYWNKIPNDADIVVTHGPPYGILDKTARGQKVGCQELLKKIKELKPKYHIFGHIHEGYGVLKKDTTTYVNASSVDKTLKVLNDPIVFDY